jgi:hypothetical protein
MRPLSGAPKQLRSDIRRFRGSAASVQQRAAHSGLHAARATPQVRGANGAQEPAPQPGTPNLLVAFDLLGGAGASRRGVLRSAALVGASMAACACCPGPAQASGNAVFSYGQMSGGCLSLAADVDRGSPRSGACWLLFECKQSRSLRLRGGQPLYIHVHVHRTPPGAGPMSWGGVCAEGRRQSPIDIPVDKIMQSARRAGGTGSACRIARLAPAYKPVLPTILNTGVGTMQVRCRSLGVRGPPPLHAAHGRAHGAAPPSARPSVGARCVRPAPPSARRPSLPPRAPRSTIPRAPR